MHPGSPEGGAGQPCPSRLAALPLPSLHPASSKQQALQRDGHLHAQEKTGACGTGAPEEPRGGQVSPLAEGAAGMTPVATARLPQGLEALPAAPRRAQGGVRREQVVP